MSASISIRKHTLKSSFFYNVIRLVLYNKASTLTIIFSKRARISFSEVILEDRSSNSEEVDHSQEDCLFMWERCVLSFLLPGIRILANRSSWVKKEKRKTERCQELLLTVLGSFLAHNLILLICLEHNYEILGV